MIARAALALSVLALVASTTGLADAAKKAVRGHVVRTGANGKVSARVLPKVPRAVRADRVGDLTAAQLTDGCAPTMVDIGTYCLMASTYSPERQEIGRNDFFFATQKCAELGGWLPTAAQLIGAAKRIKLASVITDSELTAAVDEEPDDGRRDRREMSATLVTTAAGSSAAGSQGISDGSKSDPRTGEPDPVPQPANPAPDTLQYVTVYDNGNRGGFAGSKPVSEPERFRCAFGRTQGLVTRVSE